MLTLKDLFQLKQFMLYIPEKENVGLLKNPLMKHIWILIYTNTVNLK